MAITNEEIFTQLHDIADIFYFHNREILQSGDDAFTLALMVCGGDGCISVVANEMPKDFSQFVRLCLANKWDAARKLHNKLLPLMNVNFIESSPIPVKTALAEMGMIEEVFRLPMVPISKTDGMN